MVTTINVKAFIESPLYSALLEELLNLYHLDINKRKIESQEFNIYAKMMNDANLTFEEITEGITHQKEKIIQFTIEYLKNNNNDEDNNDFYDGYEKEDEDEIIRSYYSFCVMLPFIIEYTILANKGINGLIGYLNKQRAPASKSFTKALNSIFINILK